MIQWTTRRWNRLKIQHKVWAVLLLLCVPLTIGLGVHLYFAQQLLAVQHLRHDLVIADSRVSLLRRLAVDIEDGFRGYVLTQQQDFLTPMIEAESKIDQAVEQAKHALASVPGSSTTLDEIGAQLEWLLHSKQDFISEIERGHGDRVLAYVRSGEGLRLSDRLRQNLRAIEDMLDERRGSLNAEAQVLSQHTFVGLWIALVGVAILGWLGSKILGRSLTDPITKLQSAMTEMGEDMDVDQVQTLLKSGFRTDELGQLTTAYLDMARRIRAHRQEIEALNAITHEINVIGPDGLQGVLHRITNRAVELVQADVCLALLRNEQMGCWIVEAASGEWNERLRKSVMLWEELPVCAQAYETGQPVTGERFRSDTRPQVVRRNLIGESMLAIPLLAQGVPFGVLSLLSERPRAAREWNERLAKGLAQEAAVAISNARLYEEVREKHHRLRGKLQQLEHQAEALAHDLKAPSQRSQKLASILLREHQEQLNHKTLKWIQLLERNSCLMVDRVEAILTVARIGSKRMSLVAVDPKLVINEVLKLHAQEIEERRAEIRLGSDFSMVVCHSEYMRQIFDNLISNALKYARPGQPPRITISCNIANNMVCLTVADEGIGIPLDQRSQVFEPFVRLEQSEAKGSGIGLTIVKRIVELYGGRVWIGGLEEQGCTVNFTLPRLCDERLV